VSLTGGVVSGPELQDCSAEGRADWHWLHAGGVLEVMAPSVRQHDASRVMRDVQRVT
jgi:hypothetical protein